MYKRFLRFYLTMHSFLISLAIRFINLEGSLQRYQLSFDIRAGLSVDIKTLRNQVELLLLAHHTLYY